MDTSHVKTTLTQGTYNLVTNRQWSTYVQIERMTEQLKPPNMN